MVRTVVVQCPGFEKKVCLVTLVVRLDESALEQELNYGSPFLFIESGIALNQALILKQFEEDSHLY